MQNMLTSLQNDRCYSFSQPCWCIQPPLQFPPKICSSTTVNFHLPISPLRFNRIILTIPTNMPHLYTSSIFHLPIFTLFKQSTSKIFSITQLFSQFRLPRGIKDLWIFVKNETVSICSFFLKVWTAITGLTITDSLSFGLRKLVYYRL